MVAASEVTKILSKWLITIFFMPERVKIYRMSTPLYNHIRIFVCTIGSEGSLGHIRDFLASIDILEESFFQSREVTVTLSDNKWKVSMVRLTERGATSYLLEERVDTVGRGEWHSWWMLRKDMFFYKSSPSRFCFIFFELYIEAEILAGRRWSRGAGSKKVGKYLNKFEIWFQRFEIWIFLTCKYHNFYKRDREWGDKDKEKKKENKKGGGSITMKGVKNRDCAMCDKSNVPSKYAMLLG